MSWTNPDIPNPSFEPDDRLRVFDSKYPIEIWDPAHQHDLITVNSPEEYLAYLADAAFCKLARRLEVEVDLEDRPSMFALIGCRLMWSEPEMKELLKNIGANGCRIGRRKSVNPDRKNEKRLNAIEGIKKIIPSMTDKGAILWIKSCWTHNDEMMS